MPSKPIVPKFAVYDNAGAPLSGGLIYTYESGTSTAKTTYSDSALSTANANPVVLDSRGECSIYCSGKVKLVCKDSSAATTYWTLDAVPGSEDVITDADGDTKIQMEETSDDDTIRFDAAGTEMMSISSSGLQLKMNSSSLSTLRGSLIIYNTNTGSSYSPGILFKNDNSGWEGYQDCLISSYGALVLIGTEDTWATTKTILSATPNNFTITSNVNAGYFGLYQTHTSSDGSIAGEVRQWVFQDEDMADDATVALPTGVQGICIANAYGNSVHAVGMWSVLSDGTVLLIAGTLYDDADTDGNLCLYDSGSGATLKQRLGGAAKVRVVFNYY